MGRYAENPEVCTRAIIKSIAGVLVFLLGGFAAAMFQGDARASQSAGALSGRSVLPRYESLKSDSVSLRNGPGREFPIIWVLTRLGMPVEVLHEADGWRQVRDQEGATGWVPSAVLSARRTGVILGKSGKPGRVVPTLVDLFDRQGPSAQVALRVEPGLVVGITTCDGAWCRLSVNGAQGYLAQADLWGVYPGERIR